MHLLTALLLGPTSFEAAADEKVKSELIAILANQLDISFDAAKYVSAARQDLEGIRLGRHGTSELWFGRNHRATASLPPPVRTPASSDC